MPVINYLMYGERMNTLSYGQTVENVAQTMVSIRNYFTFYTTICFTVTSFSWWQQNSWTNRGTIYRCWLHCKIVSHRCHLVATLVGRRRVCRQSLSLCLWFARKGAWVLASQYIMLIAIVSVLEYLLTSSNTPVIVIIVFKTFILNHFQHCLFLYYPHYCFQNRFQGVPI